MKMKKKQIRETNVKLSIPEVQYLRQVLPVLGAQINPENEMEKAVNDLLQKRLYLVTLNRPGFGGELK